MGKQTEPGVITQAINEIVSATLESPVNSPQIGRARLKIYKEFREENRRTLEAHDEINRLRAENNQLRKHKAESTQLLELAYQVYRDVGGKIGDNYIFSFDEWLLWLPYQTDDYLDVQPQEVQP